MATSDFASGGAGGRGCGPGATICFTLAMSGLFLTGDDAGKHGAGGGGASGWTKELGKAIYAAGLYTYGHPL